MDEDGTQAVTIEVSDADTDGVNSSVARQFQFTVNAGNDAPTLIAAIDGLTMDEDTTWSLGLRLGILRQRQGV